MVPELEDVFLLLVVRRHFAGCLPQANGPLVVVGRSLSRCLAVFVEGHLPVVDDTVDVVP